MSNRGALLHPDELDLLPSFSGSSICVGNRFKKLPWCVVVVPPDASSSVHIFQQLKLERVWLHTATCFQHIIKWEKDFTKEGFDWRPLWLIALLLQLSCTNKKRLQCSTHTMLITRQSSYAASSLAYLSLVIGHRLRFQRSCKYNPQS